MWFRNLFGNKKINLTDLEENLVSMNFNYNIISECIKIAKNNHIENVKKYLLNILNIKFIDMNDFPKVFLFTGVNGSGKTTTIGKLVHNFYSSHSIKVIAGDTFRYAASEQLRLCTANKCEFIYRENADSAALVYEGLYKNTSEIVMIDTAGRLSNNIPLMNQIQKITRSILRHVNNFYHILILDSSVGHNSIEQYRKFNEICKIDGIIMTKMDIVSKTGIIFNLCYEFNAQIYAICNGEKTNSIFFPKKEDLAVF